MIDTTSYVNPSKQFKEQRLWVNSRLKRKYGAFIRSRHWWKQFRELIITCFTHNLDQSP